MAPSGEGRRQAPPATVTLSGDRATAAYEDICPIEIQPCIAAQAGGEMAATEDRAMTELATAGRRPCAENR